MGRKNDDIAITMKNRLNVKVEILDVTVSVGLDKTDLK